ncbi:LysR family transcriptional regulator [Ramlibacter sp. G-1-2-2]|uniref:LysR family transcriptional regulator n=1 Tax=Ramlibacter agri TaxID=2728837 RepID=A0A848GWT2_9BURK|nr:LysR family transcriptional regulator [Ramlibacter agri]NML42814.1 LysR family transcriptional regulator [Ramlibacter agri]
MDIKQLKYFSTVARLGSFSRAASTLKMAQPSLSKQISNLESELGTRLLVRNGRGVTPTEAGQRLIPHAHRILEEVAKAEADVRAAGAGRFAIGLPFTVAATIGTDLVAQLRHADPSANFAVFQGRSAFLLENLQTGAIDVAIMFRPSASPLVETTELTSEDLYLMASARAARALAGKGPIPVASLVDYALIEPSRPNAIRVALEDALRRARKVPNIAMEIDNIETIIDLVARDEGFAVLSKLSRSLAAQKDKVVPLPLAAPGLKIEICMAVSTRATLSQANARLVRLTADIGRKLLTAAAQRRQAS